MQEEQPTAEASSPPKKGAVTGASLKTPKGTRDYGPEETRVRTQVLNTITQVFLRHGAV